jgi:lycopene beta-cyclase
VESQARPGGNHTWCFHARDVRDEDAQVVSPLIVHRWHKHEVRFPGLQRVIDGPYAAITSERLGRVVTEAFAARHDCLLACGVAASVVEGHRVVLDDGEVLEAATVIDARGPSAEARGCGYQKFLGLEIETTQPHGVPWPLLMDASVSQQDGFHFFYLLPLTPSRLLVEATWFSLSSKLDGEHARRAIERYATERGWRIDDVLRTESGVLPMPWQWPPVRPVASPLIAGYGGGWFHPATGYSFPIALRLARHVASAAPAPPFGDALERLFDAHASQVRYMHALNRMLFCGLPPDRMWQVFERFYRLPQPLIERFYALELTHLDRARVLLGRPPPGFSIRRLLRSEVVP